jgi:hypothetical protein
MTIPAVHTSKGNPVLELSDHLRGVASSAGFTESQQDHFERSNLCYLQVFENSGEEKTRRKFRVSWGYGGRMGDCDAVLSIFESSIEVMRRDGRWRTFPANRRFDCAAFALNR